MCARALGAEPRRATDVPPFLVCNCPGCWPIRYCVPGTADLLAVHERSLRPRSHPVSDVTTALQGRQLKLGDVEGPLLGPPPDVQQGLSPAA